MALEVGVWVWVWSWAREVLVEDSPWVLVEGLVVVVSSKLGVGDNLGVC